MILEKLIKLQEKDALLDSLRSRSSAIPPQIEEVKAAYERLAADVHAKREAHKKHLLKRKELESELAAKEEEIKKHQAELNQVKTNAAFKALQAEIDAAKKECDEIETQILACLEEIDEAAKNEKGLLDGLKQDEKASNERVSALEREKAETDAEMEKLSAERQTFAAEFEPDVLSKYEYLRAQRGGIAVCQVKITPAKKTACSGCNMVLTPQAQVDLSKKSSLACCDTCQRILYSPEIVDERRKDRAAQNPH